MANEHIIYIMITHKKYAPDLGTYFSFDIAAFNCVEHRIVEIVRDATADRDAAEHIVMALNQYLLSPIHLSEVIHDMLS